MFALRILEHTRKHEKSSFDLVIENFNIGNSYSIIKNGTREFDEIIEKTYPNTVKDNVRSIVCAEDGTVWFVERDTDFNKFEYFIMTESGKTFEKLQ